MKKYLSLFLLLTASINQASERVIYGEDNRKEVFEVSSYWKKKASSTATLVESKMIQDTNDGNVKLTLKHYGKSLNLCADEPFVDQYKAGICSGSLVGSNLIMTAGHCITDSSCKRMNIVFGYSYNEPNTDLSILKKSEVYSCKKLITRKYTTKADYAIIELDRAVVGHEPLALRREGAVSNNDPLVVIGNPQGIPTKVAAGSNVREIKEDFFVANLDTYQGNSGSAVFNENTGLVEGILVRGEEDFKKSGSCYKSNICPDAGCRGEDVTKVDRVLQFIPVE